MSILFASFRFFILVGHIHIFTSTSSYPYQDDANKTKVFSRRIFRILKWNPVSFAARIGALFHTEKIKT